MNDLARVRRQMWQAVQDNRWSLVDRLYREYLRLEAESKKEARPAGGPR